MYIRNNATSTYKVELNTKEYQVFKKVFDRLIFNSMTNVSNAFRLEDSEIETLKSINGQLYAFDRPRSIY
jgi:hypothetical protein